MESIEKFKKNRAFIRGATTKLVNQIETVIKSENFEIESLEDLISQLTFKNENLTSVDKDIANLLKPTEFEAELPAIHEYIDKISLTIFRAQRKLKQKTAKTNESEIQAITMNQIPIADNKQVKLPKLNIQKFYGDIASFTSFWNTFKVSIHENEGLTKIDKFNYLRSYLAGSALNSIEGFEISNENYDSAVKILNERFGRKDLIINHHMHKLLNLAPVHKSNDIFGLKKMHDEIEINVRSLQSLGVDPISYGSMLIAVILKSLPSDLTLEYNNQNIKNSIVPDINGLLNFISLEIRSREKMFPVSHSINKPLESDQNKFKARSGAPRARIDSTTYGFQVSTRSDKRQMSDKSCMFCKKDHHYESCEVSIEEKRNKLKALGKCFRCLGSRHVVKDCRSKLTCSLCGGRHNRVLCFKSSKDKIISSNDERELQTESSSIVSAAVCYDRNKILLQTCYIKIKSGASELFSRLLLDSGSMRSFISKDIVNKLNPKKIREEKLSVFTFGNKTPIEKTYDVVRVTLQHKLHPNSKIEIEALVTDEISGSNIPPPASEEVIKNVELRNYTLADSPDCKQPITILIGADYYYSVVTGKIKHLNKNLVAVESIFGWCLQGRKSDNHTSLIFSVVIEENLISKQIERFWNIENSGLIENDSESDSLGNEVMSQFESNTTYEDKRYTVRLPWKVDKHNLEDNKEIAEARFARLKNRLFRNPELFKQFKEVIDDYAKQGIIELVANPNDSEKVIFYLPYREIIRNDRATSKLRLVFDASAHSSGSLSLNDCLHVGPNLYPEMFDILLRFRLKPVAFTTDMRQAFLNILVHEEDRDVTRFLFTNDPTNNSDPPILYRFTRVLFGINSSPFLLAGTIKLHLKKFVEKYPETVSFLKENIYVDDVIGSHDSVEQAFCVSLEAKKIFDEASLQLHKWRSNSEDLRKLWKEHNIISNSDSETIGEGNLPYKVLGIAWDNSKDILYFDISGLIDFVAKRTDTKWFILQVLGRVFDPLGFLTPFTLRIKCLMQNVWSSGIDWDDDLPLDLVSAWKDWCEEISQLKNFSVPRYYFAENSINDLASLQLHCFSDASMKAYGTVVYLRALTPDNLIKTVFVASKNRVAPLKTLTLPRLELMGALLSAKLSHHILKALNLKIPCFYWTDSKVTYFWIKGPPEKFKPFVRNRAEEIRKLSSPLDWYHCPGVSNPADITSRGARILQLAEDSTWLKGPEWLQEPEEFWPISKNIEMEDTVELEYKKKLNPTFQGECIVEKLMNPIDMNKYSSLEKLVRITAWVKRFILRLKKLNNVSGPLTTEELEDAEKYLIKTEQEKWFEKEYKSLRETNSIEKDSPLVNFLPYIDEEGYLRLGGRLEFGNLSMEEKHPIILSRNSWLTTLIIRKEHGNSMHGGVAYTLSRLRSRFWIPKGRQMVKKVIKNCLVCKKYSSKPTDQITAPLPKDRVNETPPFSVCGLDFAGPIYIKEPNNTRKSYIVLFTCGVTRAIHSELTSDMSTDSFLQAFRRFLARRNTCKVIYSENAKSFLKAKKRNRFSLHLK